MNLWKRDSILIVDLTLKTFIFKIFFFKYNSNFTGIFKYNINKINIILVYILKLVSHTRDFYISFS